MPDSQEQNDAEVTAARPKLAEALRRLTDASIRVSPQMDESALSRPRLHLSRVKEMAAGPESPLAHEELALAARRETRKANWPGQFGTENPGPANHPGRFQISARAVIWTALLVALAVVILLLAHRSHSQSGVSPAIQTQPNSMQR